MAPSPINEPAGGSALLTSEPPHGTSPFSPSPFAPGFPQRCVFLVLLFAAELLAATTWLDTAALGSGGLIGLVGDYGARALHSVVTFAAIFVTLGYLKAKNVVGRVFETERHPPGWTLLAGHFVAMAGFAALSARLFGNNGSGSDFLAAVWLAAGILGIASAVFAIFPPQLCLALVSSTGYVWVPSAVAAILASLAGSFATALWRPAVALTFRLVAALLALCTSTVIADPATAVIGTRNFSVTISSQCSGLEGAGLMLVFGTVFLWLFRQDYRFPQALLLVPAGVGVLWLLNAVRIAVLILIGDAGAPGVALGGFHSQAGWIAFNAVALGLSLAAPRLPWVARRAPQPRSDASPAENPAAAYLVPFLVILAAGMISRATAAGFEWLYGLRFLAAGSALWFFRRKYANLNWRFGWMAPAIGGLVFVEWIAMDRFGGAHADNGIASGVAALSPFGRTIWLGLRTLGAVITVPIAEELAFRGFLIRRLIGADFESLSPRRFTVVAVVISSIAFGLLHGGQWLAAASAGLLYAAVYLRRGRIGDAVAAHATTNALIAVAVLTRGQWHLW